MGIYLGANELGGGGGAAIGDLALKPAAQKADRYVDSNGFTWLRTGVVESDTSVYPDAPLTRYQTQVGSWTSHFNGGYTKYGVTHDSLNDIAIVRSGSYENVNNSFRSIDVDANGIPDGTFSTASTPTGVNAFMTVPMYDGTDHWIAMYDGTSNASTGPVYGNYDIDSGFGANDIVFKKATGGTFGNYTTTDTGKVSTSGYTARTSATWGFDFTEVGHVIAGLAVTDDHFYVGAHAWNNPDRAMSSYAVYYYNLSPILIAQTYTLKFNKSDGSLDEIIFDKIPINNSSNSGVFLLEFSKPFSGTTKQVQEVNTDGSIAREFNVNKTSNGDAVFFPRMYSDNNGIFYVMEPNGHAGTIQKYEVGSGYGKSVYTRGMTSETSLTQTGSGPIGPSQSSEMKGEPIYIRVL